MNFLGKCDNCGEHQAILEIHDRSKSDDSNERLCILCARKKSVPGIEKILEFWGFTGSDYEDVQDQIDELLDNLPDNAMSGLVNISELLADNPLLNEVNMHFQNNEPELAIEKLEQLGLSPNVFQSDSEPARLKEIVEKLVAEQANAAAEFAKQENDKQEDLTEEKSVEQKNKHENPLSSLFRRWTESDNKKPEPVNRGSNRRVGGKQKLKYLYQFGVNLNEKAENNEIDPIVGREKELTRLTQILNRRQKNNPALIGEPGVGKTAIAEGLAKRIVEGKVPAKLLDKKLYLIDMSSLVAGTQFRGQFEARIKGVIDDAKEAGNVILVIDELHNIISAGDSEGGMNAANILKPALAKGEISVIGATTLEEYRKYIEKDSALERRFQAVMVEEPSAEETFDILQGLRDSYAEHHYVVYPDATLGAAITLSQRYLNERYLPDKAIDVLDEAGSRQNLNNELLVKERERELELKLVKKRYQELLSLDLSDLDSEEREEYFKSQALMKQQLMTLEKDLIEIRENLKRHEVSVEDVAEVIELWTGIPVQQITEAENEKLLKLEERLQKRVIGQEEAISALAEAVRLRRAGFGQAKRPASFLFVGPTGVGKTESAKALAEALFDSEENLVRLDMSEYMEAHTVSKLIGSPPGYVGYEDAGQLSEKIRRHPYSVILLDEIEKAHADVYNILLQILDDGRLSDSHGRTVNFENTVIIMTSNAGTSLKRNNIGFNRSVRPDLEARVQSALEERFRPEFLNRIDQTIIFNELGRDDLVKIAALMIKEVENALKLKGIKLEVSEEALVRIVDLAYDPKFGARPLRRLIQRAIEDPLAESFLKGEFEGKEKLFLDASAEVESEGRVQANFNFSLT